VFFLGLSSNPRGRLSRKIKIVPVSIWIDENLRSELLRIPVPESYIAPSLCRRLRHRWGYFVNVLNNDASTSREEMRCLLRTHRGTLCRIIPKIMLLLAKTDLFVCLVEIVPRNIDGVTVLEWMSIQMHLQTLD
jgi:hypothetical protein